MDNFITGDSFEDRFKDLFMNSSHSDITLNVIYYTEEGEEKNWRKPSHKFLLMISSSFFREELKEYTDSTFTIKENNITLFKKIIEFLYTKTIDLSPYQTDDVILVITLSQKYKVLGLIEHCVSLIFGANGPDKICCDECLIRYFNMGVKKEIECLTDACLKIISLYTDSFFQHEEVLMLSPGSLKMILEQDTLNISEMELYSAVLEWAHNIYVQMEGIQVTKKRRSGLNYRCIKSKTLNIKHVDYLNDESLSELDLHDLYKTRRIDKRVNGVEDKDADYWIHIRDILDHLKITENIRFLAINPAELSLNIPKKNILTDEELSDILLIQNTSNSLLEAPPGLSNIRKPRNANNNISSETGVGRRVYLTILFDFATTHIFNIEDGANSNITKESFLIVSECPVMIMAVILPPKLKTEERGYRYDEDLSVSLYKNSQNGEDRILLASGAFEGKRRYNENHTLLLKYSIQDKTDVFLQRDTLITVEISKICKGSYIGGMTRIPLNQRHQFIATKDVIQKGIIVGLGYCIVDSQK